MKTMISLIVFVLSISLTTVSFGQDCGPDAVLIDGLCKVIIVEPSHYVNTSPFYQAFLLFSVILWPYFLSGSLIFILLARTPRFKKSTRIVGIASLSLIIVGFLVMTLIGIWPRFGA